jgi:hypothetical protein
MATKNVKTKPANVVVNWRLPQAMVDDLGPDGIRDMLARWVSKRRRVPVDPPEPGSVHRCYMMPPRVVAALDREAARLTDRTGQRWTPARVAREIWSRGLADAD